MRDGHRNRHSNQAIRVFCGGLIAASLLCSALPAFAQRDGIDYDELWSKMRLYQGSEDSFFQSIAFTGRFQVDQAYVDSGDAEFDDVDIRRHRMGFKVQFLNNFTFHTEAEYDFQHRDPTYQRLTDTYFAWSPRSELELTVGKHSAPFTMDGQTSSKELITIDRSNLTNNIWFTDEYFTGISVGGEKGNHVYHLGLYSSGEDNRGFGNSKGGEFILATFGHDFADKLNANKALLRFNYVDNEPNELNTATPDLEKVQSLNFAFERDRWGVRSDFSTAKGYYGQSDLSGFMLMPFINLKPSLQLVARYTYLDSDDPNGIRFARYEKSIAGGRGDKYREIYGGVNYYFYGHKLKLQTGLQYADMDDAAGDGGAYTGWAWTSGFRVSW